MHSIRCTRWQMWISAPAWSFFCFPVSRSNKLYMRSSYVCMGCFNQSSCRYNASTMFPTCEFQCHFALLSFATSTHCLVLNQVGKYPNHVSPPTLYICSCIEALRIHIQFNILIQTTLRIIITYSSALKFSSPKSSSQMNI